MRKRDRFGRKSQIGEKQIDWRERVTLGRKKDIREKETGEKRRE